MLWCCSAPTAEQIVQTPNGATLSFGFTPAFRYVKTCSGNTILKRVIGHTLENIHNHTNGLVAAKENSPGRNLYSIQMY